MKSGYIYVKKNQHKNTKQKLKLDGDIKVEAYNLKVTTNHRHQHNQDFKKKQIKGCTE